MTPSDGKSAGHEPAGFLSWVATLVHAHRSRLLTYARRHGLDAEDALDAVQDAFISFLRLDDARSIAHAGPGALKLLTVLVRHNVQNGRRRVMRRRQTETAIDTDLMASDGESSEAIIAGSEELARVRGCILRMARLQREVVMLSLLDQQPREQVASVLGISEGYVRVLLHRAREHVRTCPFEVGGPTDGSPTRDDATGAEEGTVAGHRRADVVRATRPV